MTWYLISNNYIIAKNNYLVSVHADCHKGEYWDVHLDKLRFNILLWKLWVKYYILVIKEKYYILVIKDQR